MKRTCYSLGYLLTIHVVALVVFFLFRLMLFTSIDYEFATDISFITKATAFVKGVWFDNVIACYISILPLVVMWVSLFFKRFPRWAFRFTSVFTSALYTIAFVVSAANVPYFQYFFTNINSSIFNWFGYAGTTGGMIFGETTYILPIICGILAIAFIWIANIKLSRWIASKAAKEEPLQYKMKPLIIYVAGGLAVIGLCVFGIRGRTGYNPIKVSQAYYCQDAFLNQLGVSPTFNLLTSYMDDMRKENRPIELLDDAEALKNMQQYLNREGIEGVSPLARKVEASDSSMGKRNVVIVLMESMSARLMQSYGQEKTLTPFLDSLYSQSRSYRNFYSSGIHTNHGITATLYSFPTVLNRNAMKGSKIPRYVGLPDVLAKNGYRNMFFMSHESQYDNMNAFFRTNGFHEIYAQEDYPAEEVVNSFGVPDAFLFKYALNKINEKAKDKQPFFSVILTISNHPPYIIPDGFKSQTLEPEDQIVEYADRAIADFMQQAKKEPWYNNTIFVFLGDHGKIVGTPECEMPQSYNNVPLMIYGEGVEPQIVTELASQVDVAPTLLSMLGIGYVQNNFGVDLNAEKREYVAFTTDKQIAARDSSHLYIYEPADDVEYCYEISNGRFVKSAKNPRFEELKKYCFSTLQSTQYFNLNGLTGKE